MQSLCIK